MKNLNQTWEKVDGEMVLVHEEIVEILDVPVVADFKTWIKRNRATLEALGLNSEGIEP